MITKSVQYTSSLTGATYSELQEAMDAEELWNAQNKATMDKTHYQQMVHIKAFKTLYKSYKAEMRDVSHRYCIQLAKSIETLIRLRTSEDVLANLVPKYNEVYKNTQEDTD